MTISSQQKASPSTWVDYLQNFESQAVQITSRSWPASQTRPKCIQPVEGKLVSIGQRHSRATLFRLCLTTRGQVCPDRIQRTHLDRFQQVGSLPTHTGSSQPELLMNRNCECHTEAKCDSSRIMTEKALCQLISILYLVRLDGT
jgi:hypothetical protein